MDFSKKIKLLRHEKEWSQGDLSNKLNIHRMQISTYERGLCIPNTDILLRLAKVFDVSLDYLMFDSQEGNTIKADIKDKELLKQFEELDKLNEETRKIVKEVIDMALWKNRMQEMIAQTKEKETNSVEKTETQEIAS
ncbi:MAG: helix-turn-helix domain-containing protein [Deltaproteobacteria bacterium]|nr:helix-turn-helix domain-containing protein [Deltaproteobacteria bacterium]